MSIPKLFASPEFAYPSRRDFLQRAGNGFGMIALTGLLEQQGLLSTAAQAAVPGSSINPLAAKQSHFPSKAKRVIWLFLNAGL